MPMLYQIHRGRDATASAPLTKANVNRTTVAAITLIGRPIINLFVSCRPRRTIVGQRESKNRLDSEKTRKIPNHRKPSIETIKAPKPTQIRNESIRPSFSIAFLLSR
jgi:hypothetical protein